MLREHGFEPRVIETGVDDGALRPGAVPPAALALALAYFKAAAGFERALESGEFSAGTVVLAADTFLVKDRRIIGKPADAVDARRIIGMLIDGSHEVITGVCLLDAGRPGDGVPDRAPMRRFVFDRARVHVGAVGDDAVGAYLESGDWRGKAGGYNLSERIAAGWPIRCSGDPATVMGLPMQRLGPMLVGMMTQTEPVRA